MAISITAQQLRKLDNFAFESYISELVEHCGKYFPYLNNKINDLSFRDVLKKLVVTANEKGFSQRGSVQFYIDMSIMFGSGFIDDPQYPWIESLLIG